MLKNYTSSVSAERSISFIESKLAHHGAKSILKEYDANKQVSGVSFIIPVNGADLPFKLPARIAECEKILLGQLSSRSRPETKKKISEQAARTAWKIQADWIEAQMAMVELAQVEITEVFLPYLFNFQTQKTAFQTFKEKGFKNLLPAGTKND
jgi:hypothetical protein